MLELIFHPVTILIFALGLFVLSWRNRLRNRIGRRDRSVTLAVRLDTNRASLFELLQLIMREVDLSSRAGFVDIVIRPRITHPLIELTIPEYIARDLYANHHDTVSCVDSVQGDITAGMPPNISFTHLEKPPSEENQAKDELQFNQHLLGEPSTVHLQYTKTELTTDISHGTLASVQIWGQSPNSLLRPVSFSVQGTSRLAPLSTLLTLIESQQTETSSQTPALTTSDTPGISLSQLILFAIAARPDGEVISYGVQRTEKDQGVAIVSDDSSISQDIPLMHAVTDIHHGLPTIVLTDDPGFFRRLISHVPIERHPDLFIWSLNAIDDLNDRIMYRRVSFDEETFGSIRHHFMTNGLNDPINIDTHQSTPIMQIQSLIRSPIIVIDVGVDHYEAQQQLVEVISDYLSKALSRMELPQTSQMYTVLGSHNPFVSFDLGTIERLLTTVNRIHGASLVLSTNYASTNSTPGINDRAGIMVYGHKSVVDTDRETNRFIDDSRLAKLQHGIFLMQRTADSTPVQGKVLSID